MGENKNKGFHLQRLFIRVITRQHKRRHLYD